jgi:hypothetical protein
MTDVVELRSNLAEPKKSDEQTDIQDERNDQKNHDAPIHPVDHGEQGD